MTRTNDAELCRAVDRSIHALRNEKVLSASKVADHARRQFAIPPYAQKRLRRMQPIGSRNCSIHCGDFGEAS